MPEIHLPVGGSTVGRMLKCPGSRALSKNVPSSIAGAPADIGTLCHIATLELHLIEDISFDEMVKNKLEYNGHVLTADMVNSLCKPAIKMIDDVMERFSIVDFWTEIFTEFEPGEIGGSVDFVGLSEDKKTVMVGDLKTGRVPVHAEEQSQLAFYLMCLRTDPKYRDQFADVEKVVFAIFQPPVSDEADVWETDIDFIDRFQFQMRMALRDDSTLNVGDHCQYCKAAFKCPKKTGRVQAALRMNPEDAATLADGMDMVDDLKAWIKAVEDATMTQLQAGQRVGDWAIVPTRPTEYWKDEETAKKELQKHFSLTNITKSTLASPAQVRKVAKAAGVDLESLCLTEKKSKGQKLAKNPESMSIDAVNLRASLAALS